MVSTKIAISDYLCFYVLKEAVIKQGRLRIKEKQQKEGKPLQHNSAVTKETLCNGFFFIVITVFNLLQKIHDSLRA